MLHHLTIAATAIIFATTAPVAQAKRPTLFCLAATF